MESFLYGLYPLGTGSEITGVDKRWHLPPYSGNQTDINTKWAVSGGHPIIRI